MNPKLPDIKDIVPPEPVIDPTLAILFAAFVGLTIIGVTSGIIALLILRSRQATTPDLPQDPATSALTEIAALETDLPSSSAADVIQELHFLIARLLHRRYGIPALFRTPDELVGRPTHASPPPLPGATTFTPLLRRLADSRHGSLAHSPADARSLLEEARAHITALLSPSTESV